MNHPIEDLWDGVRQMFEAAWTEPGFCVPNPHTYPHQWLWDSCFHAIVWVALGRPDRAERELTNALAHQDPVTGFVPHMTYWSDPDAGTSFWGRPLTSSITQPPMYGHAIAELTRSGHEVSSDLLRSAIAGLMHLFDDRPRTDTGLIAIVHPWETGCDDSARFDDWRVPATAPWDPAQWRTRKTELVAALSFDPAGITPARSSQFQVASVSFNALIAWNARELVEAHELRGQAVPAGLVERSEGLVVAITDRWDHSIRTWTDADEGSGRIRTLDGMLGLLVDPRGAAFDELVDPLAYGSDHGPAGTHLAEPSYDPNTYWRGPAWPQLGYLLWCAARRAEQDGVPGIATITDRLGRLLRSGAESSRLSEYWNPETGEGLGACPQTWTGLGIVPGNTPITRTSPSS